MNLEVFANTCDASAFFSSNAAELSLPPLTRRDVDAATSVGRIEWRDGVPVLVVDGTLLGEPLAPEELQRALHGALEGTVFVVVGLGAGHVPRALRAMTNMPIIVFEPNAGILRTHLESGPSDLGDIPIVTNKHDLSNVWARYAGQRRDAITINTPGYSTLFPEATAEVPNVVRRLVERIAITKNTYRKRARSWVSDVLQNAELLLHHPPILTLENEFAGVPAFIVGAGPSLDKNVALLERAKAKGLIFAANSAALALGERGIAPHVVVCLESIDISERLRALPFLDEVVRAFSLSAHPNTLRTGKGPLLPMYEAVPQYSLPLEELTGVPGLAVCGSVSTAAFSLAERLGCSPIILVGQDMAFTHGRTYAGGTGYESSTAEVDAINGRVQLRWNDTIRDLHGTQHGERHDAEPLMEVQAWGGDGQVASGPSFMAINNWLEGMATNLSELTNAPRLINATEGGARVRGFEEIPLERVLDQLPDLKLSAGQIAERARSKFELSAAALSGWSANQAELTRQTRRRARRVRRLAAHAAWVMQHETPRDVSAAFAALGAAEAELKRSVARAPLIDAWSHAAIDALMLAHAPPETLDARASAQGAIALGARIAAAVEEAARELEATLGDLARRAAQAPPYSKGNS